jgi:hypothetical protein
MRRIASKGPDFGLCGTQAVCQWQLSGSSKYMADMPPALGNAGPGLDA